MKILFTGASSFTGCWFIHELQKRGHQVVAIFQQDQHSYTGIRRKRVEFAMQHCQTHFVCSFGDEKFLQLLATPFDLVCQHAAMVSNYRSPDFDVATALANNTYNLSKVLKAMQANGCQHLLLTGSIFEQNEGLCSSQSQAISPYGLSKGLTSEVFRYYCMLTDIHLGKFVIPNPFGALEEERFTTYLAEQWLCGRLAEVKCPDYVRDNIPVSLLAKAYASFAESFTAQHQSLQMNPSFRPESLKKFSLHFSKEMEKRWHMPCPLIFHSQTIFNEPAMRINTDVIDWQAEKWHEASFWDSLAAYYMQLIQRPHLCNS